MRGPAKNAENYDVSKTTRSLPTLIDKVPFWGPACGGPHPGFKKLGRPGSRRREFLILAGGLAEKRPLSPLRNSRVWGQKNQLLIIRTGCTLIFPLFGGDDWSRLRLNALDERLLVLLHLKLASDHDGGVQKETISATRVIREH